MKNFFNLLKTKIQNPTKKITFAYLTAFSQYGGIEKFNKALIYTIDSLYKHAQIVSLYDKNYENKYLKNSSFKGFNGSKIRFVLNIIRLAFFTDILIIGHINISIITFIVKLLKPSVKIITIAHGIEVWNRLNYIKTKALIKSDIVLTVSSHTKNKIMELHKLDENKIKIFHNTLDPFFQFVEDFDKPSEILNRYNLNIENKIILSVNRMSANEAYKGYDKIIEIMPKLSKIYPNIVYLIVGKYDKIEKQRLDNIIKQNNINNNIIFTGFIPENELEKHYLLADLFVMPSINEGFGIVFIEAMACGIPVIAGNVDGSKDALCNGKLGTLVNPHNKDEIFNAIKSIIYSKEQSNIVYKKQLQKNVINTFGIKKFMANFNNIINNL